MSGRRRQLSLILRRVLDVSNRVEAACRELAAAPSPSWLVLPAVDVGAAIATAFERVRTATPEAGGSSTTSLADHIRALYLSEGLWALDAVSRRLGTSVADSDPTWLADLVMRPEFAPLRPDLALSLVAAEAPLEVISASSIEQLMEIATTCREQMLGWWVKHDRTPQILPGSSVSLDGFVTLPDAETLVWLVSWDDGFDVRYKALAARA